MSFLTGIFPFFNFYSSCIYSLFSLSFLIPYSRLHPIYQAALINLIELMGYFFPPFLCSEFDYMHEAQGAREGIIQISIYWMHCPTLILQSSVEFIFHIRFRTNTSFLFV